jgi:hypothetical protein
MPFFKEKKMQILNLLLIKKGLQPFRTGLGLSSLESSWSNEVSVISEFFR